MDAAPFLGKAGAQLALSSPMKATAQGGIGESLACPVTDMLVKTAHCRENRSQLKTDGCGPTS
jgi:hypothetical protein